MIIDKPNPKLKVIIDAVLDPKPKHAVVEWAPIREQEKAAHSALCKYVYVCQ
jgi:hypothetical protein